MMHQRGSVSICVLTLATLSAIAAASPTAGQTITGVVAGKNAGNSPDEYVNQPAVSYERESTLAVTGATATTINTRYTGLVSVDSGLLR